MRCLTAEKKRPVPGITSGFTLLTLFLAPHIGCKYYRDLDSFGPNNKKLKCD